MNIKKIYDRCFEIGVIIIMFLWLCIPDIDSKPSQSEVSIQDNIETINKIDTVVAPVNEIKFAEYPYTVSKEGKQFIKDHENLKLTAYNDPTPTKRSIGWGHQIQPGENYTEITEAKAEELFNEDMKKIEASVNRLLNRTNPKFKYTQSFIDGLASMVYNCGERGVTTTDFYKRLLKCRLDNSEDNNINEADLNFTLAAVKTSKVFCKGHKVRRANEYALMLN